MFDALPTPTRSDLLDEVRCFFADHGHDLSDAACLIAGVSGDARVISLALRVERALALDKRILRDLAALCAMLALEDVREGDPIETFLLTGPGPASEKVYTICRLTDLLQDLLTRIDASVSEPGKPEIGPQTIITKAA